MTISKEKLSEIALELGEQFGSFEYGDAQGAVTKQFAHALLKRVEAECEVVGYQNIGGFLFEELPADRDCTHFTKLIALPLVEGD